MRPVRAPYRSPGDVAPTATSFTYSADHPSKKNAQIIPDQARGNTSPSAKAPLSGGGIMTKLAGVENRTVLAPRRTEDRPKLESILTRKTRGYEKNCPGSQPPQRHRQQITGRLNRISRLQPQPCAYILLNFRRTRKSGLHALLKGHHNCTPCTSNGAAIDNLNAVDC